MQFPSKGIATRWKPSPEELPEKALTYLGEAMKHIPRAIYVEYGFHANPLIQNAVLHGLMSEIFLDYLYEKGHYIDFAL